jgi:hypothetical protein
MAKFARASPYRLTALSPSSPYSSSRTGLLILVFVFIGAHLIEDSNARLDPPGARVGREVFSGSPICNTTTTCIHAGGNCSSSSPDFLATCANGYYCSGSICTALPTLGQYCYGSGCFDPIYQVACVSATCQYQSIYGPGEACSTAANYANGGCPIGYPCVGTCEVTATGSDCSSILCHTTSYCDPLTMKCLPRVGAGANCTNSGMCQPAFTCTGRGTSSFTCQTPFAQGAGSGCSTYYDCAAGLACVNQKCQSPTNVGTNCQNNAGACNTATSGSSCTCSAAVNGDTTTDTGATCQPDALTQAEIDAYNNAQTCLVTNGCFDLNWRQGDGASLDLGVGPNSCSLKCVAAPVAALNQCGLNVPTTTAPSSTATATTTTTAAAMSTTAAVTSALIVVTMMLWMI